MKKLLLVYLCCWFTWFAQAQELYNLTQPASTLPKGVLGVRIMDETYNDHGIYRQISALKVMYGVGAKFTIVCAATAANYHSKNLPLDFIKHNHSGSGPTVFASVPAPVVYPYIFNGVDIYAQYRFFSKDGQNTHIRMATYAEASDIVVASHLAEPDLLFHNSGIGAGIIGTYLSHHFAASLTGGFIIPKTFIGNAYDNYGGIYPTKYVYGNAGIYNLALGYLLYPAHYKSYNQTNINVYLEFLGKSYGAASVTEQDGVVTNHIANSISLLKAGNYIDLNPGIQFIIHSNLRIDASIALNMISQSYVHTYPTYILAVQRYFYRVRKR